MKKFTFSLDNIDKLPKSKDNVYDDETKKLTSIDSLESETTKVSTESFNEETQTGSQDEYNHILWGNSSVMNGPNNQATPPPFIIKKGRDESYYIHLFGNRGNLPAEGQIYQLLNELSEKDIVHFHIHEVPFYRLTLLQSALLNSKATIHTYIDMVEPSAWESPKFFLWMTGKVLEPIPYNIIGLVEPKTIFCYNGTTSENRRDSITFDATLKQNMYDYAVQKGLLKLEELTILNEGRMVIIKDMNERIKIANASQ